VIGEAGGSRAAAGWFGRMVEIGRKREQSSRTPKADLKVGQYIKWRRDIVAPFLCSKTRGIARFRNENRVLWFS
jgi:hypothetical protein